MKEFAYYVLSLLTRMVFLASRFVPERTFVYCARKVAALYVVLSRHYRQRIAKNVTIAFGPSCQHQQITTLTRELGNHLGTSVAEMFFSATPRRTDLLNRIHVRGMEHLEKALAMGKGVVAVSGHIGNFTLMSMKMVEEGYPFIMLVKESKYETVAKVLRMLQDKQGGEIHLYAAVEGCAPEHSCSSQA